MGRLIGLIGLVMAVYLIFQFNSGDITANQIFSEMGGANVNDIELAKATVDDKPEPSFVRAKGYFESIGPSQVFLDRGFDGAASDSFGRSLEGAILPPNFNMSKDLTNFFNRLSKTRNVDTFVIIGENHTENGKMISIADFGFDTVYGEVHPNFEIIEGLMDRSMYNDRFAQWEIDNEAFEGERSFTVLMPFLKTKFPNSRVVAISVEDGASGLFVKNLINSLDEAVGQDDFVIGSVEFSNDMRGNAAHFHSELTTNVVESFSIESLGSLDVDSVAVLNILFGLLDQRGHRLGEVINNPSQNGKGNIVAGFSTGDPLEDRVLTIMGFGDMMLGRYVRTLMNENGMDYIFENIAGSERGFFKGADIIFANLEGPIKGVGKSGGTAMNFAFNEDIAPFLEGYGFNLFSISNNHSLDAGYDGYESTIAALEENDIGWCGHPSSVDPNAVYYGEVGNKNYAFLCFQDVTSRLDDQAAQNLVREVSEKVDFTVVSIHWGPEYKQRPDYSLEVEPGRAFIDAGADLILGHHPHVVQSIEEYNGKLIFYSLGNFVFDQYWSEMTQIELGVGIVLDEADGSLKTRAYLFPMQSEKSQPRLMSPEEYKSWAENLFFYGDYGEELQKEILNGVIEI